MFDRMQYVLEFSPGGLTIKGTEGNVLGYVQGKYGNFKFKDALGKSMGEGKSKWLRGTELTDHLGNPQGKISEMGKVNAVVANFWEPVYLVSPSKNVLLFTNGFRYNRSWDSPQSKMEGMIEGAFIFSGDKKRIAVFKKPISSNGIQVDILSKDYSPFLILSLVTAILRAV